MGSLVLNYICGHVCIVGDYSTHLRRTGITVRLGLILSVFSIERDIIITYIIINLT